MNKNSKWIMKRVGKAVRAKETEIQVDIPVRGYHNYSNMERNKAMTKRTVPVPVADGKGVVSRSLRRNMQERVLQNKGSGGTQSLTVHEPINPKLPVTFKNHSYMEYRQPPSVS